MKYKKIMVFFLCLILYGCTSKIKTNKNNTTTKDLISTILSTYSSSYKNTLTNSTTTKNVTNTQVTITSAPITYDEQYCELIDIDYDWINEKVKNMTIDELAGQMIQAERNNSTLMNDLVEYNIGSVLSGGGSTPSTNTAYGWQNMIKNFQDTAVTSSSGIPIIYGVDAVHGHNNLYGATIFPHNIGLGSANDPELMYKIGLITAREMRASGVDWTFSPTVAMAQDISWGRTYESFSESVEIVNNLVSEYIRGLQSYCVSATAKHYIADGSTVGGKDQGNVTKSIQDIMDFELQPYIKAVEAGVDTVMVSYSSINGEKMHESKFWITDILKDSLEFSGFVISDYDAIRQLPGSYYQQVVSAVNAGIDMLMQPYTYKECHEHIVNAFYNGDITRARLEDAARRILTVKYKRGIIEYPGYTIDVEKNFASDENKNVAREAVRKSLVLLKNENKALPLDKNLTKYYITGDGAINTALQCGGWTLSWQGDEKAMVRGTSINAGIVKELLGTTSKVVTNLNDADVVIVVLSDKPYAEYNGDTDDLTLTGGMAQANNQKVLNEAKDAKSKGKKVIGLLLSGRPLVLNDNLNYFDSFVACFLPGSEAGSGIADVLFGDYDFTGKLSFTWPKNLSQLGYNSNKNGYDENIVMFPIGYGLSYKDNK